MRADLLGVRVRLALSSPPVVSRVALDLGVIFGVYHNENIRENYNGHSDFSTSF